MHDWRWIHALRHYNWLKQGCGNCISIQVRRSSLGRHGFVSSALPWQLQPLLTISTLISALTTFLGLQSGKWMTTLWLIYVDFQECAWDIFITRNEYWIVKHKVLHVCFAANPKYYNIGFLHKEQKLLYGVKTLTAAPPVRSVWLWLPVISSVQASLPQSNHTCL